MSALFVKLLSSLVLSSGLKLLTEPVATPGGIPLKPYKPVGGNVKSDCVKMEMWEAYKLGYKFKDAQSETEIGLSPGSACAAAMDVAGKKYVKVLTTASATEGEKEEAADAYATVLDRCCQSTSVGLVSLEGQKNVGFGAPRLPGVANNCVSWTMAINSDYSETAFTSTKVPTVKFYDSFHDYSTAYEQPTNYDSAPKKFWSMVQQKVLNAGNSAVDPKVPGEDQGELVPTTDKETVIETICGSAATTGGSLACLKALREQCKQSGSDYWKDAEDGTWLLQDNKPQVCAGFCVQGTTRTFYKTNFCYLELATGATKSGAGERCYSTKSPTPKLSDMPKAFNDPKVVNMAGEKFEILQSGTFTMLQVVQGAEQKLQILATIDRAGSRCGATYIQNVSLHGAWVSDLGVPAFHVRAEAAVPKKMALQVSVNNEQTWLSSSQWKGAQNVSFGEDLKLMLRSTVVEVSVDSHRIVEGQRKTRRFANFLNLNVKGVHQISGSVGGLLGSDNHEDVTQLPKDCEENLKPPLSFAVLESLGDGDGSCSLEECGATMDD